MEVIVVAVIVAVLAGVSIPLYNGYVENSRANAAANAAGSTASFMGACYQADGAPMNGATAFASGQSATGPDTLTCNVTTGSDPQIFVPRDIVVRRVDNTILGRHVDVTAGEEGESSPYAFPAEVTP